MESGLGLEIVVGDYLDFGIGVLDCGFITWILRSNTSNEVWNQIIAIDLARYLLPKNSSINLIRHPGLAQIID